MTRSNGLKHNKTKHFFLLLCYASEYARAIELSEKIELEEVTIKMPKPVMDFLRKTEGDPVDWIEYVVVDDIKIMFEGMSSDEWVRSARYNEYAWRGGKKPKSNAENKGKSENVA